MSERTARLRAHYENIERYESLLKTELRELELQYLEQRLAEERFTIAMLKFMEPSVSSTGPYIPGTPKNPIAR